MKHRDTTETVQERQELFFDLTYSEAYKIVSIVKDAEKHGLWDVLVEEVTARRREARILELRKELARLEADQ
jgi:hypothetical protein